VVEAAPDAARRRPIEFGTQGFHPIAHVDDQVARFSGVCACLVKVVVDRLDRLCQDVADHHGPTQM
jgi:hypothetical protein